MELKKRRLIHLSIELNEDLGDCYTSKTDSIVWVATNNGLIRFNPKTNDFIRYTSMDGLADNNINGIVS
jgi:ligand-binding sensor domain-containing protein